ncbi:uncharacterized protein LOC5507262, partial [Nematostella vectensis]|uniref:uncharacterized protein LOC5507262 n=1 Tax=Nematostella vectensis TaxID=45351 RepID=UPI002076E727
YLLTQELCDVPVKEFKRQPTLKQLQAEYRIIDGDAIHEDAAGNTGGPDRRGKSGKQTVVIASALGVIVALLSQSNKNIEKIDFSGLATILEDIDLENKGETEPEKSQTSPSPESVTIEILHEPDVGPSSGADSTSEARDSDGANFEPLPPVVIGDTQCSDRHVFLQLESIVESIATQSQDPEIRSRLSTIASSLVEEIGVKAAFKTLLGETNVAEYFKSLRVPDWMLLYYTLESRTSDEGWQMLLNLTKLGRTRTSSDTPILLCKNQMKTIRKMVFAVVRQGLKISPLPDDAPPGYQVSLHEAVCWAAREAWMHNPKLKSLASNIV